MHPRTQPFSAELFVSPAIIWTTCEVTVEDEISILPIRSLEIDIKSKTSH
jgi:hypothetical protein